MYLCLNKVHGTCFRPPCWMQVEAGRNEGSGDLSKRQFRSVFYAVLLQKMVNSGLQILIPLMLLVLEIKLVIWSKNNLQLCRFASGNLGCDLSANVRPCFQRYVKSRQWMTGIEEPEIAILDLPDGIGGFLLYCYPADEQARLNSSRHNGGLEVAVRDDSVQWSSKLRCQNVGLVDQVSQPQVRYRRSEVFSLIDRTVEKMSRFKIPPRDVHIWLFIHWILWPQHVRLVPDRWKHAMERIEGTPHNPVLVHPALSCWQIDVYLDVEAEFDKVPRHHDQDILVVF
mmetsp:Transcript_12119/g.19016  ORF Transcript_12119/g.19016 Transcript_12119/m.19016 type:complete len:284 (-) Transcript_12119:118-969(-)